jgi:hypothetical protein
VDGINKGLCRHFIIMSYYWEYILTLSVIVITESIDSLPLGLCRRKYEIDFNYNLGIEKSWIGDQDDLFLSLLLIALWHSNHSLQLRNISL